MYGSIGVIVIAAVLFQADLCLAGNSFGLDRLDYFSNHEHVLGDGLKKVQEPIDWREPVMGNDGKMTYYVPPVPVLRLLDDPTPENARAYLAWQEEKTARIIKAQEAITQLQQGTAQ